MEQLRKARSLPANAGFPERWIRAIVRDLLEGLVYLHDQRQIHRDVKAGNILLSAAGDVKIGDFGVAGWMTYEGRRGNLTYTFVGTPCWMAPEVMDQSMGYDAKADIWSVGITMLELARGYAPYARLAPMEVLMKTLNDAPPSLASYDDVTTAPAFSRDFQSFVSKCLLKDPKKRPSALKLISDPFISGADTGVLARELIPLTRSFAHVLSPSTSSDSDSGAVASSAAAAAGGGGGGGVGGGGIVIPEGMEDRVADGTTWVFWDGVADSSAKPAAGGEVGEASGATGSAGGAEAGVPDPSVRDSSLLASEEAEIIAALESEGGGGVGVGGEGGKSGEEDVDHTASAPRRVTRAQIGKLGTGAPDAEGGEGALGTPKTHDKRKEEEGE
jgi:hypothetical protein